MGVARVDLPGTAPHNLAYLSSPVESYLPSSLWAQSQPCMTNVRPFAPMQSGILHARSEVHFVKHSPLMHHVFPPGTGERPTNVMPVDADVALWVGDENFSVACSDTEFMDYLADTTHRCQWPKPARDIRMLVVSKNVQTYVNHGSGGQPTDWRKEEIANMPSIQRPRCGLSGNHFPSSVIKSTGNRHTLLQRPPQDQELQIPAPIGEEILCLSTLFPSQEISQVSLETRGEFLQVSRDSPQPPPSPMPIESCATSYYSKDTSSSKQQDKNHRVRHRCEICHKEFAQRQGVRRHQLEKHQPNHCPHCPTFKWGRLYHFKQHLKKKHPEVDVETATFNRARRRHQSDPIPFTDHTYPHVPLPRSISGRRSSKNAPRATVWPSPAEPRLSPPLPSLDTCPEALNTGHGGEMPRVLYPS